MKEMLLIILTEFIDNIIFISNKWNLNNEKKVFQKDFIGCPKNIELSCKMSQYDKKWKASVENNARYRWKKLDVYK